MSKIGVLTTGAAVVTEFDLTFCPQFIQFACATPLTAIKVTVEGRGVVCDLDSDGILAVSQQRQFSAIGAVVVAGTSVYNIQLATGIIKGVNVTISVTNSAAQTPTLYAYSNRKPTNGVDLAFVQSVSQKALAGTGVEISKFGALFLPNAAATDPVIVNFADGTQDTQFRDQLRYIKALYSAPNPVANNYDYQVYNWDQNVKSVNFTPASDQKIYVTRYVPTYNVSTKL